jgi:hypothetical protein
MRPTSSTRQNSFHQESFRQLRDDHAEERLDCSSVCADRENAVMAWSSDEREGDKRVERDAVDNEMRAWDRRLADVDCRTDEMRAVFVDTEAAVLSQVVRAGRPEVFQLRS